MADPKARIVIAAKDDTAAGVNAARNNFAKLGASLDGIAKDMDRLGGLSSGIGSLLKGGLAGLTLGATARQFVTLADSLTNTQSRLRLVTQGTQDFTKAQNELFQVAQRTSAGFSETVDLFASLSRSTKDLGVSQAEVVSVTESINQALIVSGTNAESAAAALVQLGQGFASGVLRGEELNSVMEQAPRLAQAIADGLGVPLGKLRELGKEGQLTADKVFGALQKSAQSIQNEFSQMPTTVAQASTQAANSILMVVGAIDETSGATKDMVGVIKEASRFFDEVATDIKKLKNGADDVGVLAEAIVTVTETVKVLGANIKFVLVSMGREIGAVIAQMRLLASTAAEARANSNPLDIFGATKFFETWDKNKGQFNAISEAVKEDGKRARAELDAFEKRVLSRQSPLAGLSTRGLLNAVESEKGSRKAVKVTPKVEGDKKAAKDLKTYADEINESLKRMIEDSDVVRLAKLNDQLRRLDELAAAGLDPRIVEDVRKKLMPDPSEMGPKIPEEVINQARKLKDVLDEMPGGEAFDGARSAVNALSNSFKLGAITAEEFSEMADSLLQDQTRLNSLLAETPTMQLESQRRDMQLLAEAFENGAITAEQFSEAAQTALGTLPDQTQNALDAMDEFSKQAARNIQDTLGETVKSTLKGDFDSIGDMWENLLTDMVAQVIAADLGKLLMGDFAKTGAVGGVFGGIAALFGGAFADGGFLGAGKWGIAGEKGAELIKGPAEIVPLEKMAGGGGDTYVYSPVVSAGVTRNELAAALQMSQQAMRGEMAGMFRRMGVA